MQKYARLSIYLFPPSSKRAEKNYLFYRNTKNENFFELERDYNNRKGCSKLRVAFFNQTLMKYQFFKLDESWVMGV